MLGQTVWIFDPNRRVYAKDPKTGRGVGGPIYREHFREAKIDGETSRSWLIGTGKIPKSGPLVRTLSARGYSQSVFMTREAMEDDIWLKTHAHRIEDAVGRVRDVATLRQVAEIIDYNDGTKKETT